ncbi:hypothetical protein AMATHDRAFT_150760 [Amanita thiersii Skay4041]|uniref:Intradiol ring-cleavage dioxygenases domain-containing protein n=1 Tax=Amanita thiersii Skay4041 TaxID=703135 RepID=A0A2A9ND83_9AGAR|nr:hypothetical protein AMATHDRAFT_150760 [Amanita thiersii Skay4041]
MVSIAPTNWPRSELTKEDREPRKFVTEHGVDLRKLPNIVDMSSESITRNVVAINSSGSDDRMKFLFKSLITHLHAFVRETSLTTEEWMTAIQFLTETGKKCTDIRQEFILLSDTLGVSTLVDTINNAKPPGATEATVLGPFYTEDAHEVKNGDSIASEGKGEYMFVEGTVVDMLGNPIPGAIIDTWETDGFGQYDTQYDVRDEPECRGRLRSAEDGSYAFRAVLPVSYPIPDDGPVGRMIKKLGRHPYRPAHLHIRIEAPGFDTLVTALYFKGDPYLTSDAVFGVRSSLILDPELVTDTSVTLSRGFKEAKPHTYVHQDFILAKPEESEDARRVLRAVTKGSVGVNGGHF